MSSFDFDAIVIGSGFGGAVSACRLAERGSKVLVLERGRRWTPATYPRDPTDAWLWSEDEPHRCNGWADLRVFSDMSVIAGAGVGGGSLIYANVSVEAKPEAFRRGWPPQITYEALKPYYERAGRMLAVQELPDGQLTDRFLLMKEGAEKLGWASRFRKLPLAVSFDPQRQPGDPVKTFVNAQGRTQSYCIQCGDCDIGCQVSAKNTLDLNYLAVAEDKGAEIRPLHLVVSLEPLGTGWRVHADRLENGRRERTVLSAQRVLLGAGSIGTTELLLRCRDEHRTLPALSSRLGYGWAFNGDFVTPTFYKNRMVSPSKGVTISCAIDLLDGVDEKQSLFIEDGGVPNLAGDFIRRRIEAGKRGPLAHFWKELSERTDVQNPVANMMPWFGQGIDAADGRLRLGRLWYAPWRRTLKLDWRYQRSEAVVEAMVHVHRKLSAATGGDPWVPPTWTWLRNLITPHPLGGCNMGITADDGVCDADGKVFGYENLHVMDGAAVPRAIGLNPSRTIAALAERNVEKIH